MCYHISRIFFLEVNNKMLETFLATLDPLMMLFICIIIGFIARKTNLIPETSDKTISTLENYVFSPALILVNFMSYCTLDSLKKESYLFLYGAGVIFFAFIVAKLLAPLLSKKATPERGVFEYSLTFGNFGFFGNAVVPAILGAVDPRFLYKYLLFCVPLYFLCYSWGFIVLVPSDKKQNPLKRLINPMMISVFVGAILGLIGATNFMPKFIMDTLNSLKACMGPLAMILAGFVIGGFDIVKLLKNKKVYIATALRLIILPIVFVAILILIKAPKDIVLLSFFAFSAPLGLNTIVFPAAYGGDTRLGGSMALVSHTLCVITIPILYSFLQLFI